MFLHIVLISVHECFQINFSTNQTKIGHLISVKSYDDCWKSDKIVIFQLLPLKLKIPKKYSYSLILWRNYNMTVWITDHLWRNHIEKLKNSKHFFDNKFFSIRSAIFQIYFFITSLFSTIIDWFIKKNYRFKFHKVSPNSLKIWLLSILAL